MINLSNLRRRSRRSRRGTSLPPTGCGSSGPIVAPHYPSPPVEMPRRAEKRPSPGIASSPDPITVLAHIRVDKGTMDHPHPTPPHTKPRNTWLTNEGGLAAGARSGLATQTRSFAFVGFFPKTRSTTPERCMTLYGNHPHTLLTMRPLTSPPGHDTIRDRGHPLTAGRSQRLTPSIQTLQQASRTTAKSVFSLTQPQNAPAIEGEGEKAPAGARKCEACGLRENGFSVFTRDRRSIAETPR